MTPIYEIRARRKAEQEALVNGTYGVLLIDMQEFFISNLHPTDLTKMLKKQLRVMEYCKKLDVPVVALYCCNDQMYNYGDIESTILEKVWDVPRYDVIGKEHDDAFFCNDKLEETLSEWELDTLLFMGINDCVCVKESAEGATGLEYKISTARGLISSPRMAGIYDGEYFKEKGIYHSSSTEIFELFESIRR